MTNTSNPTNRPFHIERQAKPERSAIRAPIICPGAERSLRSFLETASLARNEWHSMPGYKLALRIVACNDAASTIAFDLSDTSSLSKVHRFRYDPRSQTIFELLPGPVEHPELVAHSELPDESDSLARAIASLVRDNPALQELLGTSMHSRSSQHASTSVVSLDSRRPGPLSHTVSDILRQLTSHWFGGRHVDWGFWRRYQFAFFGSAVACSIFAISEARNFPTVYRVFRDSEARLSDLDLLAGFDLQIILFALLSVIFARITALLDHQHGPARLFLGGLLLPYLVFTLHKVF